MSTDTKAVLLDPKKVVIGMSGGVDSTVAAFLLKQQGYDVIGVTMKTWDDPSDDYAEKVGGCCSLSAVEDARRAAAKLDIPFYVLNFKKAFKEKVIDTFIDEYRRGRTPNPCIACNKHIKFDLLLRKAHELGAWYVATGHYARIRQDEGTGRWQMLRSLEASKDQTYMLYNMTQYQLAHTLMPLGQYASKDLVRKLAEELDLAIASKPDSQEICFIPDDDYIRFLEENMKEPPKQGWFVDSSGNRVAPHRGITHYTIGQRKGLGVALGRPVFVTDIDPVSGNITLGDGAEVYGTGLIADAVNWITDPPEQAVRCSVKIRHTTREAAATVEPLDDQRVRILFDEPQRAITPGQGVVFYQDEVVCGGGIIVKKL